VNLIYVGEDCGQVQLQKHGKLADIGVTLVTLLGLEVPEDMTADNLVR
jgi:bisphosphoglycerate-independent phosphoglycerate mutase (AlkP superfamily)